MRKKRPAPTQQELAQRRLTNQAKHWTTKFKDAFERGGYEDVARVAFDRAKAAARTAERRAGSDDVWRNLADSLNNWAEAMEAGQAQPRRYSGDRA